VSIRHVVDDSGVSTARRRTTGSPARRVAERMRSGPTTSGADGGRPGTAAVAGRRCRRRIVDGSERYHYDGVQVVERARGALQLRVREVIVDVVDVHLLLSSVQSSLSHKINKRMGLFCKTA